MRVIAGTARSMPIKTVKGMDVRPTTDRTKETLFNILMPRVPGCRFLDLYAGSGAIGIEALSRGASHADFVENNRRTRELIIENLKFTKLDDRAEVIAGDADSVLLRMHGKAPYDIIFMDPPFDKGLERGTLEVISRGNYLAEDGIVVVEASPRTDFSYLGEMGYRMVKERTYGMSRHIFLELDADRPGV